MNRILAGIIAVLLFLCNFSGISANAKEVQPETEFTEEEKEYAASCGTLKVGYVRDRKPISFHDDAGELGGISRNIFDRISEITGLKFEYIELPAGDVTYDYLLEQKFDLVTGVEYNKENQKARGILMSDPYLSSRKVIVAKEGLEFNENGHFKVAISTGSQTIRKVLTDRYPNFELYDYDTIEDCLTAVNEGEVDLLIQNQYVVEYWLYKPIYSKLKVIPVVGMDDQLCFSAVVPLQVEEDDPDWQESKMQIDMINKAIAMMSDGEVAAYIIDATMGNMYKYTIGDFIYQYRYTLVLLGIALVMIGILLYVNMTIRIRSIKDRANAKAKGDFLSTMSHEIRTPLNGVLSLNYLMSQNLGNQEKLSNYLKQSSSVAQYLLSLVNNILDMSKLQESDVELEHRPLNLQLLLETVESIEMSSMEEKGIEFTMDIALTAPEIMGDEIRIQQILINLIDNARKYTPEHGRVAVEVKQDADSEGNVRTTVDVIDNGRGMSEEFQKKLFDPFTQESSTVSQGNQGTGLGMAICSLLAKRMGGSLEVESKLGEGSHFTFTFFAEPVSMQESEAESKAESKSAVLDSKPTILIAEDNELNGEILLELLSGEGYLVTHVDNGRKAVETFEKSAPGTYNVILMDLLMPEMNGYDAAKAIRALKRPDAETVKIFACTANSFKEDRDKALASGMDDFIAKPIDIQKLLKKLDHLS